MGQTVSTSAMAVLCLWQACALSSTIPPGTTTTSDETIVYNPTMPPDLCNYNFTGPSEDIFIIDRSASFSKASFESAKEFVKDLISRSFYLENNQNYIAVYTFASIAKQHIDFVSSGDIILAECELFIPGGLWEDVAYDPNDMHGENLKDAVDLAWNAFALSPRKDVAKRLWLMTDFHDISTDLSMNRFSGVEIYGYSDGSYIEHDKFIAVIGEEKASCNYRTEKDWIEAKATFVPVAVTKVPFAVPVTDERLCGDLCPQGCTCPSYFQDNVQEYITCTAGTTSEIYEGMDITIIIAACAAAVGVVVIFGIIIVVCLCCRKNRNKAIPTPVPTLNKPVATNTDTMQTTSTDASTYTNHSICHPDSITTQTGSSTTMTSNGTVPSISQGVQGTQEEDLYENGFIAKVLHEHGVVQDSMSRNRAKEQQDTSTTAKSGVAGKLYKKNQGAKLSDGPGGKHNANNTNATGIRPISELSTVSSTPSYMVPIADDQSVAGSAVGGSYSYPYLDMNTHPYENPGTQGPMSPPSTHSYEKFTFPRKNEGDNSDTTNTPNGLSPELAEKLSKMRGKVEDPENTPNGNGVSMRYPERIPPTNPRELADENNPTYIDPADENQAKRSSAKIGTLKFKNLFYMFSQDNIGQNGEVEKGDYSYSVPYSTATGPKDDKSISKPFREIM